MQLSDIPSYVGILNCNCIPFNLTSRRCCILLAISILMLSLLWLLYHKCISRRNSRAVNKKAFNKLHKATFENDVITSYRIIQKFPAAINIPHPIDGYTPFMRACLNGNTQLVQLMLHHGADISHTSSKGETPFYLAVFYHIQNPNVKDASCIHTLYHAGANINVANNKGYAPLHLAAMFGHSQLVQWLLRKGVAVAIQPDPFVLARLQGHYETAKLLEHRRLPAIE